MFAFAVVSVICSAIFITIDVISLLRDKQSTLLFSTMYFITALILLHLVR